MEKNPEVAMLVFRWVCSLLFSLFMATLIAGCASNCNRERTTGRYPHVQHCEPAECKECSSGYQCRTGEHCVDGCCRIVDDENLLR